MSAFSQNHATSHKGATNLTPNMHSKMQPGLTNAEGISMNGSPEGAVAGFYSEIKVYDFNNPVRSDVTGKFAIDRITNHQKI